MRFTAVLGALAPLVMVSMAEVEPLADLKIDYDLVHKCKRAIQDGDHVEVHYTGSLYDGGNVFDTSYKRGQPLPVTKGRGTVIQGFDQGLEMMCPGDKRTIYIPSRLGYGERGIGPIPAHADLVFEIELVKIKGIDPEPLVVVSEKKAADDKEADKPAEDKASEPEPKAEAEAEPVETPEPEATETAKEEKEEL